MRVRVCVRVFAGIGGSGLVEEGVGVGVGTQNFPLLTNTQIQLTKMQNKIYSLHWRAIPVNVGENPSV